ncbi:TolC family protein [Lacimicrobium alkaliphilum]|uniref:Transporter n=1 Tax=Lacimicrobium alkaliphilum TaxID=1526571 RepID=A0A0U3B2G2_9ALTE|nr:TolC family protein [Lacimicrobium alkaliphilum]ALS99432.1 transporter [Lacimicrobium alkaliphilum]
MRPLTYLGVLLFASGGATDVHAQQDTERLALDTAVVAAIKTDPWLSGSQHTQQALNDEATAASTLPDPRVSLMAANFPLNGFDLNQEGMTQLVAAVTQMLPRGDSLKLASQQKLQLAQQHPLLRQDRQAKVKATVTQLWLEAFRAQESIRLLEQDRSLFEQLMDAAEAGYSSAIGKARQQDVIRAQLELTRLQDRLTLLSQQRETAEQRLLEWIGEDIGAGVSSELPEQSLALPLSLKEIQQVSAQARYEWIRNHPELQALEQRINATRTSIALARQKYKPQWGLTAQYGYRYDDPMGSDRADLFSVGVSFDLPVFTQNRQDKEVSAAVNRTEAIKTEKRLRSRQLMAALDTAIAQLVRLGERHALYTEQLLPQMAEQAEASLSAYNNDDGDFSEAVRARIAELNARIDGLSIAVDRQKTIAQINYLLTQAPINPQGPATSF